MSEQKAFFEAIRAGDLATVKSLAGANNSLASARNDAGVSAVLTAVYMGRGEIRDFLLATGASLDLSEASAVGNLARVWSKTSRLKSTHSLPSDFRSSHSQLSWATWKSFSISRPTAPTSTRRPRMVPVTTHSPAR